MSDFLPKELKKAIDKAGKQAVIDSIKKDFEATYNTDKRVNATLKKVYFNKDYSIKGIDVNYTFVGGLKELEK